jgi:hypothetical protein
MADTPVEHKADDPYHRELETRVSRLEDDVRDVKATMGRLELLVTEIKATLDATLPHLATKAELAELRTELKGELAHMRTELKVGLAEKPSKSYMWGVLTALLTAYACGLAALAILK